MTLSNTPCACHCWSGPKRTKQDVLQWTPWGKLIADLFWKPNPAQRSPTWSLRRQSLPTMKSNSKGPRSISHDKNCRSAWHLECNLHRNGSTLEGNRWWQHRTPWDLTESHRWLDLTEKQNCWSKLWHIGETPNFQQRCKSDGYQSQPCERKSQHYRSTQNSPSPPRQGPVHPKCLHPLVFQYSLGRCALPKRPISHRWTTCRQSKFRCNRRLFCSPSRTWMDSVLQNPLHWSKLVLLLHAEVRPYSQNHNK